jgi:hypothetical protein
MVEKLLTEKEWKALPENSNKTVRSYRKYKRQFKKEHKEGDIVGMSDRAGKLVEDVKNAINPPKAAPGVKIDFNVEVEAVVRACDENRAKIDRVQDIIVARTAPGEHNTVIEGMALGDAMDYLEEIYNTFGSLKVLTVKMMTSYKEADAGISILEKEAENVQILKKKLAVIRATRTKEKMEAQ